MKSPSLFLFYKMQRDLEPSEIIEDFVALSESAPFFELYAHAAEDSAGEDLATALMQIYPFTFQALDSLNYLEFSEKPYAEYLQNPFQPFGEISLNQLYAEVLSGLYRLAQTNDDGGRLPLHLFLVNGANYETLNSVLAGTPVDRQLRHYFPVLNRKFSAWNASFQGSSEIEFTCRGVELGLAEALLKRPLGSRPKLVLHRS